MALLALPKKIRNPARARRIAVIGAGWSGLSAAIVLTRAGQQVTVFEAAAQPGGRARSVADKSAKEALQGRLLDNGQHILLGAYQHTLTMMDTIGVDHRRMLSRLPLQMWQPDSTGLQLQTPDWPMPINLALGLGLLRAKGLSRQDKMSIVRFFSAARWMGWQQNQDIDVLTFLQRHSQTAHTIQHFWRPLCIGALNTLPEQASVIVFLNVLRDALAKRRRDSDMLIPRVGLGALFPLPACDWLQQQGTTVRLSERVSLIANNATPASPAWSVSTAAGNSQFDCIIVATAPHAAANLLSASALHDDKGVALDLSAFDTLIASPIMTCYLQYAPTVKLERSFYALADDADTQTYGQFVFDRGQISADPDAATELSHGLLAVVISAAETAMAIPQAELAHLVALQLARALQRPELATPLSTQVINEKRATHQSSPGLLKPSIQTGCSGLLLAGDYLAASKPANDYPATLETAVRTGWEAALAALSTTPDIQT